MSIYTISLKRELLNEERELEAGADRLEPGQDKDNSGAVRADADCGQRLPATHADDSRRQLSPADLQAEEEADWLDCVCGQQGQTIVEEDKENRGPDRKRARGRQRHSSECLAARREQLRRLKDRAREIVHSVNVSLEVTADLSEPRQIVWYKNKRQVTSNEKPVFYAQRRPTAIAATSGGKLQTSESTRKSIKRTRSTKRRSSHQGYSIEETKTEIEEQLIVEQQGEAADSSRSRTQTEADQLGPVEQVVKCKQESSDKGSKLTIFDLQEEDYGEYTCRLIDLQGNQFDIHTRLKEDASRGEEKDEKRRGEQHRREEEYRLRLSKLVAMDEVIEVKEGDLNIELGIQILPETNDDEELMSEEEKAEFVANTTISWFKDDVKLNQQDAAVLKLFQFTYDQQEGFHRLIVRKATKETEGVYTCLVENESGTSSCSTQLVVGPGNKPKLTSQLQDVTVYVGQSLEFRIKSTGLPPIDSCQWFKDDELLIELASSAPSDQSVKSKTNERISMSRSEEWSSSRRAHEDKVLIFRLCIDSLKLDDTGRYKCRINNEYGYDESDCFVKVLQEIIEEHEEIEETIEETLRLGGGKRTTREEAQEETTETLSTAVEVERDAKRQKGADGGRAPQFRRQLQDRTIVTREEEESTTIEETLMVTTVRDESSRSAEQLKLRWLIDGKEIGSRSSHTDSSDENISYSVENFYDETGDECFHKLLIRQTQRRGSKVSAAGRRIVECEASNQFGEARTSCQVRWVKRPRFLRSLEDTETRLGETVLMKVTVEQEEEEEVGTSTSERTDLRFLHDGKLVYSSRRDGQQKDVTTASRSKLRVKSYEEIVEEEETTTTTTVTRRRFSRPSVQKRRGRTYEISIENTQLDQQGTWECQAENEAGESSCRADLEVFAEPKIVTDLPADVRMAPGKEIRLTVEASGSPTPVYSWFKDGLGIAEEEERVFTETKSARSTTTTTTTKRRSSVTSLREEDGVSISGETLIIRDARPEDEGVYTCKVENRLGQVESRQCRMTVIGHGGDLKGAPKIIKDLSRDKLYQLDEGETLALKVLAEGQPRPSQHWFKDTEEIVERETRFELEQVGQEYKLTCRRVKVEDSGSYKVVLRNEFGETESKSVRVQVNKVTEERESQRRPSAPSIIIDSKDKIVGLGSDVSFDVEVGGHPKPMVTWFKNGRRLTETSDGRVTFVEEETTTTSTISEEDGRKVQREQTTTVHKLVIRDVRESDEAIYSLKAENELGSNKSSLVSLSVDKRKAATDELSESRTKAEQQEEEIVEETTTTTTTVTQTKEERDETLDERQRRSSKSKTRRVDEMEVEVDEAEEELDEEAKKRAKTTKTTRTTTKRTTTTTTQEEEEEEEEELEEEEEARRRRKKKEEEESKSKSKRRVIDELEEEIEEEEEETKKRRVRSGDEQRRVDQDEERRRDRVVQMDVDEEEEIEEEELEKKRRRSRRRDSQEDSTTSKRRDSKLDSELIEERRDEEEVTTKTGRRAPRIVSAPKEVIAGLGSSPELEVVVEETVTEETSRVDETKVTWLKDGQPIPERLTRDNHIEFIERSGDQPNTRLRTLRINSLRSSDEAEYVLKVENPHGATETAPIKVAVDRTMRPGQRPSITPADIVPAQEPMAPEIVGVPEEVVAGVGSSPQIEAEIKAEPKPELSWFKDGQPLPEEELKSGHLEVVDLLTEQPDVVKQALKINDLKPADVAAYHVKAENPAGEVESEPTNVRIDRSMGPKDEPVITGLPERQEVESRAAPEDEQAALPAAAPTIVSAPKDVIAGAGSKPQIVAEVAGSPEPQLTWLKDGQPVSDRDLRLGHLEVVDLPGEQPGVVRQALQINDLRPTDVADYQVKAENPLGSVQSQPTSVKLDRTMGPRDEPIVKPRDDSEAQQPGELGERPSVGGDQAPTIVHVPEEIVAGPGSSPQIVAEVEGKPQPQLSWFKDGKLITDRDLRLGHLEVVELPTEKPNTVKQALRINDLRPTDVAAYHVKAENPLGQVESQPTSVRLDRRMSAQDKPKETPLPDEEQPQAPSEGQSAPTIVSVPEQVAAGRGGSPQIEAEVAGNPEPKLTWLKDGQPISERDLRTGHVEILELPTEQADHVKQALKINDLRPADVADYQVKAENPLGSVESEPTKVKIDRSLSSTDEPVVKGLPGMQQAADLAGQKELPEGAFAPSIVSVPEEVVAGRGSSPILVAEIAGKPQPEVTWFKDGQPLPEAELKGGHLEVVDIPTDKPDTLKQALKIHDLKPADVAAYHVKAENPLGEVESEPTNVRIDRSMTSHDRPKVSGLPQPESQASSDWSAPTGVQSAPKILSAPEEIVTGPGSNPQIEAEIAGSPKPELTWLKDGKTISDGDLRSGHLEVVDLATDKPDTVKQALKINDMRPSDVADYQVQAENPLGSVESQPTSVKLDRSMTPRDKPLVKGLEGAEPDESSDLQGVAPTEAARAPKIISAPKEVVAGPGGSPQIEAEVEGVPRPQLTWFKDGVPIRERQLSLGHLEVVELPTDKPGVVKQALKINDLRPTDAGAYHVKAENPLGEAQSEPTSVRVDRRMSARDLPKVEGLPASQPADELVAQTRRPSIGQSTIDESGMAAPAIVSLPDEIVAGVGSSPQMIAEVTGKPQPQISWFKDGQLLSERDLQAGHLEIVDLPAIKPDTLKQALKINNLEPTDAAAYHVKAENPIGESESNPTNLRLDRSMGPRDEPQVRGGEQPQEVPMEVEEESARQEIAPAVGPRRRSSAAKCAPEIVSAPKEVVAAPGSSPKLELQLKAQPAAKVQWLKDGEPIPARLLRDGHIQLLEESTSVPGVTKHWVQINEVRPSDVASYTLKAENPLGDAESEPMQLKLDRSMSRSDAPRVVEGKRAASDEQLAPEDMVAPRILSAPEQVVAGPGSSPQIEAEVSGVPRPELSWFKDGQPVTERDLANGHLELIELPTDKPDAVRQALKINDLRPADVAAYHMKAENPLGEVQSEPTSVRIDRSMGPLDEPIVSGVDQMPSTSAKDLKQKPSGAPDEKFAPQILNAPDEVVAGLGSSPQVVAEVAGNPAPQLTWLKDGAPISDRDLRNGHIELVDLPSDQPDAVKQALKINDLRPSDVAAYQVRAENPLGAAESQPTSVKLDRRMSSIEAPVVKGLEKPLGETAAELPAGSFAPSIVNMPEEVVAGRGSSPILVAEIAGKPQPEVTWFKDGQPLPEAELKGGHLEVVDIPTDKPDTLKQALKIHDLKPADVAAYHVKAENPLGEVESEPTNVRIDRSMTSHDRPKVIGEAAPEQGPQDSSGAVEKPRINQLARNVKCPLGSSPVLDVEVMGGAADKVEWFKDGQPVRETPDMHVELESLPDGTQKLQINNFNPDDVGVYSLRASNKAGVAESGPINVETALAPAEAAPIDDFAPEVLNTTEEVIAGPGSHPQLEVHVRAQPQAEVSWYKDGKPLTERQLGVGHLALSEEKSPFAADAVKYVLKVDRLKPTDAATYFLVAKNPLGTAESKPIQLKLDRSLEAEEAPIVVQTHEAPAPAGSIGPDDFAPQIIGTTDEVVAGAGSSPTLEAAVKARPAPQTSWFKDGQPIGQAAFDSGHFKVEREQLPDDTIKEKLVIVGLKPDDAAAYHVKAENPLGEVESGPTNVRIDRSMSADEAPQVSKSETPFSPEEAAASNERSMQAPSIRRIPRKIVAPLGSSPSIEVEISGEPKPEVVWFKDGRQVSDVRGHIALVELPDGTHKLCITNLKAVDQGDYTIKATNAAGEVQSAPISLVIDSAMSAKDTPKVIDSTESDDATAAEAQPATGFAPKIVRASDKVTGELGGKARVEVEVQASPQADVNWLLDGQQIPSRLFDEGHLRATSRKSSTDADSTVHTLEFDGMKPSDAGAYRLEAENPFGSAKSPSIGVGLKTVEEAGPKDDEKPKKKMRAPVIKRAPGRVVAREGTSPVLEVEVSGQPEVVWLKNGKRIERTDAHFTFEDQPDEGVFRLTVNECVKDTDEAVYTLQATNEAGTVESGPIELKIEASPAAKKRASLPGGFAPQIVSSTEEVVAGVGSSPVMEVIVKASPGAEVSWFKDGQEIDLRKEKKKFTVRVEKIDSETSKHSLQINELRPSDVAAFHARAENPHGCTESEPTNVRIDRAMGAHEAPLTSVTEQPFEPAPEEELEGRAGVPTSGATSKRPLRAPVIKRMPRRIVAPVGSNPVIEIEISGTPKPEIVWYKNGKRVSEIKNRIEFVETPEGTYKLCFTDVKVTDQAEYSVTATNEAGSVDSGPIELIVDRSLAKSLEPCVMAASELPQSRVVANEHGPITAPKILGLDDQVEALPGDTVKLEAEVVGNPKPEIKWLKDGDEVELNIVNEVPDSNRHSLTLRNVNDLYDGVYSLEAKNEAGVARKDAKVKIVDELTAPRQAPEEARFQAELEPVPAKRKSIDEPREKPFIKRGLKFSQVNQGRSIMFEVQIEGKYDELIWMKDGQQINAPEHLLLEGGDIEMSTIREVDDDDASTIKASDDEQDELLTGPDSTSGRPKRRFPPRILMRPRNIVAGPGSRVAFEVKFEGEPRPEVVWFRNGERVTTTSDGKVSIEEIGQDFVRLVIEDVQTEDVGTYQVQLDNTYGQERSLPVRLELDAEMPASDDLANYSSQLEADQQLFGPDGPLKQGRAPRILSRPRPVHAPPGSKVAFEVEVAGEPEPIVNWYRDGRIIKQTSDGHVTIEEFSKGCVRLVLDNIGESDVGLYHVVAENRLGSERTIPVTLTIDESETSERVDMTETKFERISQLQDQATRHKRGGRPPRVLLRPKHLEAPIGGEVRLEVMVVGQTKPSIVWHKDGQRLQIDGKRVRVEEASESYQRLVISELSQSDSGSYTVTAENDFGVSMSEPAAKLVVSETVRETQTSSMTTTEHTMTTTTSTTTTTEEHETFYEHFVDGGQLHAADKPSARRAPRFTVKPRNKKQPIGSTVEFAVKVRGEPKPDVVWYKSGRRIHTRPDGRVRVEEFSDGGSKLVIEDLEETDHGVYAAEAENEWGKARTEDVQLRVTQRTEVSERHEKTQRGSATVTTKTKRTRSHYTFSEERHGYVTLTINDAQLDHDGDYKLLVRNKWGEASTQAPLVVIPKVEPRSTLSMDRSASGYDERSSVDGRDSRARRTPFDELEDYGHELDKSVGVFGSESRYQSGEDTYLLQLRDTEFPLRLRKYLRFGARQSPSLRSNLMDAHWGAGARVTVRERRKFREVMDEEIDDEKSGRDLRMTPMRIQKEIGTCGNAAARLELMRVEAAERITRRSAEPSEPGTPTPAADMMPPFFRVKLKDAVIEESGRGSQEAVFVCLAAGEPKPDYTWFKNDTIITPDVARMTISELAGGAGCELRIRDPCLYDAGCFKCVARNPHGNVTTRARLRVASRPSRPSRPEPPEYTAVTAREILLQWRPPRDTHFDINTAPVLGYRLEMSQSSVGQDDDWRVLAPDIGHEYYVVDDLTPATSYTFRVSARNKFGWSDTSYSAYVTTRTPDSPEGSQRLPVPHEWRSRQFVSEVCDVQALRNCEDDKLARHLNYAAELQPVSASSGAQWHTDYQVQAEIARGRFSIVSKGISLARRDEEGRARPVVMKFVAGSCSQSAQTKAEFDILRSLQHEKVAQLEAAYRADDVFVFVLERLSGLDVLTYLSSFTSYNEETVSQIVQQVMDAIEYLHFRGMCLLELQPDNVVMTNGRSTSLKLVDFASARFVPRSGARVPQNASQTIEYCPPEVIAGHEVSTASDVWCIGVLTYVLLSGFSPFRSESGDETETRENVRLGRYKYDHIYGNCTPEVTRFLINVFKKHSSKRPTIEQLYENKWLLPNEFMIKKRQHATFKTDKIAAFAEQFHKLKQQQQEAAALQQLAEQLSAASAAQ